MLARTVKFVKKLIAGASLLYVGIDKSRCGTSRISCESCQRGLAYPPAPCCAESTARAANHTTLIPTHASATAVIARRTDARRTDDRRSRSKNHAASTTTGTKTGTRSRVLIAANVTTDADPTR